MIKNLLFYFASFLLFLHFNSDLHAQKQTGTIRGVVTDSTNGEVLAFANVYIQSLNKGTTSDRKGLFFFTSIIPPTMSITLLPVSDDSMVICPFLRVEIIGA